MCDLLVAIIVCVYGSIHLEERKREREEETMKKRERKRENRFPFSRARLPLAQRSLISSSPNSTVTFFFSSFGTLLLSTCSTLSHRNVHHVLFRSRDQHCCASVLRTCRLLSPCFSILASCFSNSRRNAISFF